MLNRFRVEDVTAFYKGRIGRILQKKWYRRSLPLQLLLFVAGATVFSSAWYKENNSFGPAVVFAAYSDSLIIKDQDGVAIDDGYYVKFEERRNDRRVSNQGALVIHDKTNPRQIRVQKRSGKTAVDSSQLLDVRDIRKMEFKVDNGALGLELWTIQYFPKGKLRPASDAFHIEKGQFSLYRFSSSDTLERIPATEVGDIEFRKSVSLNGIEIVDSTLLLLGFDGDLYTKHVDSSFRAQDSPEIWHQTTDLEVAERLLPLMEHINPTVSWGWQGIDRLPGEQDRYAVVNAKSGRMYTLREHAEEWTIDAMKNASSIDTVPFPLLSPPENARWHEGAAVRNFKDASGKEQTAWFLTEAFHGELRVFLSEVGTIPDFTDDHPYLREVLLDKDGEPSYLEGAAINDNEHAWLFVSDRTGMIHFIPCAHVDIFPAIASWRCRMQRLTPGRIWHWIRRDGKKYWEQYQLPDVGHGQEIAVDENGNLWFAEDNYFRMIHSPIFSMWFQWGTSWWVLGILMLPFSIHLLLKLDQVRTSQLRKRSEELEVLVNEKNEALIKNEQLTVALENERDDLKQALDQRDEALLELEEVKETLINRITLSGPDSETNNSERAGIVGDSKPVREMIQQIHTSAGSDAPVLVLGETGTGKELVARAFHKFSRRRKKDFHPVNCGDFQSADMMKAELFGCIKGAFTGADRDREGLFEVLDGGTLFLDEIADMPLPVQTMLLRVLEDGEFTRMGDRRKKYKSNVRIIAATNKDLEKAIAAKEFREDLYFRLNTIIIRVPPLRTRKEDILPLVKSFYRQFCRAEGKPVGDIPKAAIDLLMKYDWQGNIRELRNIIHTIVIMNPGGEFRLWPHQIEKLQSSAKDVSTNVTRFESLEDLSLGLQYLKAKHQQEQDDFYIRALKIADSVEKLAEALEVPRTTLYDLLKKRGINPKDHLR